jgi:type I restriction enzyme M protein
VLDKEGAAGRKGIFMVDASKGFIKDGNKNRLRAQDIHKIVDTFTRQLETPKYSRMVPLAEVEANDYNLNLPRYIDSTEPEDLQDIAAHLMGGIPNADIDGLAAYWQVFPSLRQDLFTPANRPGYSQPLVEAAEVKTAIFAHPEFTAFNNQVTALFATWTAANMPLLTGIQKGQRPKALIETLSENLLDTFRANAPIASLIDPYGVYQHLMDYWSDTLQDDVWMIASDGWQAVQVSKPNTELIPPALVIARYFAAEHKAMEQLEAARDAITRQMEELDEEHGGDDGLLADAKNDKGKLTKLSARAQLARVKHDQTAVEERKLLETYLALTEQEAAASISVKDAAKALESKVSARYSQLTQADIQTLVVNDKWLVALGMSVQGELDRVSQTLTGRIKQLTERYATPIPQLAAEVEALADKVDEHLKKMGFVWN